MKMLSIATPTVLTCVFAAMVPAPCSATPFALNSQLSISGDVILGSTFLSFLCNQPGDPVCVSPPAGRGDFAASTATGSFAQYGGTFGLINSINNAAQPLNTSFSLPNFITFDLNNNVSLELTFIPLGSDPISTNCAGLAHCTPQNSLLITPNNPQGVSAFNFDQNVSGTTASFLVSGIAHSGTDTGVLGGVFTITFPGLTPQQALALALAGIQLTYSATLQVTGSSSSVPEPAPMLLTGVGLFALLVGRRKWSLN